MMRIAEQISNGFPVKLAFFGDSVTEGCFESLPAGAGQSVIDADAVYHNRLSLMIRSAFPAVDVEIINAGRGGDSAGMGLFRIQESVIDKKPDFCCVCFGLNDTLFCILNEETAQGPFGGMLSLMAPIMDPEVLRLLKEFRAADAYVYALATIFTKLKEANIEPLLMLPNCMNDKPTNEESPEINGLSQMTAALMNSGAMDGMMEAARQTAKQYGVPVADCYADWRDKAAKGQDINTKLCNHINHPDRDSHQLFADKLFQAIFS